MFQFLLIIIYLAFISLGLPDAILGAAWPSMYQGFSVPVSYAGILSMLCSGCTILSSLLSDRLTRRFGTGKVTAFSVFLTALGLFGFSASNSFWALCLWSLPFGLGAGSVDAALNNYVALHYASRHMSWLHCMWGIGASLGPYVMSYALTGGQGWHMGYRYIALLQFALTALMVFSLPLWKKGGPREEGGKTARARALTLGQIWKLPGAREIMVTFFCYCSLEQTAGLWASSYLVLRHGMGAETAAGFASLFFLGITAGRALSGFLTLKLRDLQMIRLGQGILLIGALLLLFSFGPGSALAGFGLMGLGCAPIYPSVLHSTPDYFGPERSQAMIGVQMASAYVGTSLMPPLFGLIANHISAALLPVYLLLLWCLMTYMHARLIKKLHKG